VAGFCERGDEPSGSTEGSEFLDSMIGASRRVKDFHGLDKY
jgi:hypothetical protein